MEKMLMRRRNKPAAPPAHLPRIPYEKIKYAILGDAYDLSYATVSAREARAFNKKYRRKSYVPDVLAFPLSKTEGEIVLNVQALAREAKKRKTTLPHFATYIFIHACLHLKGFRHGKKMREKERLFLKGMRVV